MPLSEEQLQVIQNWQLGHVLNLSRKHLDDQDVLLILEIFRNKHQAGEKLPCVEIDFSSNSMGEQGVILLVELASLFPALKKINLSKNELTDVAVELLASIPLDELILNHNFLGDMRLNAFAHMQYKTLSLIDCRISDAAAECLSLAHVETLVLTQNYITDVGAICLAKGNYKRLILDQNAVSTVGLTALLSMQNIEHLNVSYNAIEKIEVVIPEESAQQSKLTFLELSHNRIESIHELFLAQCVELTELSLNANRLNDLCMVVIALSKSLLSFSARNNAITNEGASVIMGTQIPSIELLENPGITDKTLCRRRR